MLLLSWYPHSRDAQCAHTERNLQPTQRGGLQVTPSALHFLGSKYSGSSRPLCIFRVYATYCASSGSVVLNTLNVAPVAALVTPRLPSGARFQENLRGKPDRQATDGHPRLPDCAAVTLESHHTSSSVRCSFGPYLPVCRSIGLHRFTAFKNPVPSAGRCALYQWFSSTAIAYIVGFATRGDRYMLLFTVGMPSISIWTLGHYRIGQRMLGLQTSCHLDKKAPWLGNCGGKTALLSIYVILRMATEPQARSLGCGRRLSNLDECQGNRTCAYISGCLSVLRRWDSWPKGIRWTTGISFFYCCALVLLWFM